MIRIILLLVVIGAIVIGVLAWMDDPFAQPHTYVYQMPGGKWNTVTGVCEWSGEYWKITIRCYERKRFWFKKIALTIENVVWVAPIESLYK